MTPNWQSLNGPMTASDLNHNAEKYLDLKAVMLFPKHDVLQHQYLQSLKLQEIKHKSPAFLVTQAELTRPRPAMGAKGPPSTPDPSREKLLRDQEKLFGVPSLVDLVSDLPPTSLSVAISSHTTDGVLAGTMLMYLHTLSTGNFKTAAGRSAKASQNIATFICGKHNLGRERTPTFLHRYETHALAKAARNAFQAALEIRNSDKVRPGKGKKKKAFEVGDSEYRTGYMHERGFDICHYVKNRDTETVAVFTDDEERTAVYDEAERYHRVETKLHGAWLTKNKLDRPEDWRLYGQERAYEKAYSIIRKTLRLDEGLRASKPSEEEIQQLSELDQTVLRWHLADHHAQQHECILAKPTALARQQYFSDMKLRIMKKLHVDISVRWRRQERAMSGGLSAVLHYPGMYTPPPELEKAAYSTDSVRNAIHELKSILARMMPRNLSNLQLEAETIDSPPITLGSLVVSDRARRALDKYLMPLHKLLGCHMWGIFGDVAPDEAIRLSEAAQRREPVTSRYTLGNFVILVTTQYLADSNGVIGPVTSVTHSAERT